MFYIKRFELQYFLAGFVDRFTFAVSNKKKLEFQFFAICKWRISSRFSLLWSTDPNDQTLFFEIKKLPHTLFMYNMVDCWCWPFIQFFVFIDRRYQIILAQLSTIYRIWFNFLSNLLNCIIQILSIRKNWITHFICSSHDEPYSSWFFTWENT